MFDTAFPFDCNNVVNLGTSNIFNFQMIQITCIVIMCDWFWLAITANMVLCTSNVCYVQEFQRKFRLGSAYDITLLYECNKCSYQYVYKRRQDCNVVRFWGIQTTLITVLTWRFFLTAIHVVHVLLFLCIHVDNSSM